MSSLRLALKQSLEESGGGPLFSGNGDKKKRKKKKTGNLPGGESSLAQASSQQQSQQQQQQQQQHRRGKSASSKRKRGRPRKHGRAGEKGRKPQASTLETSTKTNKATAGEREGDDLSSGHSEHEFTGSEDEETDYDDDSDVDEDDYDDDVDDSEVDDEEEGARRNRRRSLDRRRKVGDEEEDDDDDLDMEDEPMPSDDDEAGGGKPPLSRDRSSVAPLSLSAPASEAASAALEHLRKEDATAKASETAGAAATTTATTGRTGRDALGGSETTASDVAQTGSQNRKEHEHQTDATGGSTATGDGNKNAEASAQPAPSGEGTAEDSMEALKKKKLSKLKKKQEKDSAAHKIQNQWKKKARDLTGQKQAEAATLPALGNGSSTAAAETKNAAAAAGTGTPAGSAETASPADVEMPQTESSRPLSAEETKGVPDTSADASTLDPNSNRGVPPPSSDKRDSESGDGKDGDAAASASAPRADKDGTSAEGPDKTNGGSRDAKTSGESPAAPAKAIAAGDGGGASGAESDGELPPRQEEDADRATKKKKKNKNKDSAASAKTSEGSGIVPAPTREVVFWGKQMPQKRARKAIEVGMRVKVRFATNATRIRKDGRRVSKKIFYGGKVTAKSALGSKIKIKYDDGTSEVSKFPDKDVVVDAVGNGEHAVPAGDFLPPEDDDNIQNGNENENKRGETEAEAEGATAAATTTGGIPRPEGPPPASSKPSAEEEKNPGETASSEDAAIEDGEVEETKDTQAAEPAKTAADSAPVTPRREATDAKAKEGKAPSDEPMAPAFSPEEGELSPGITFAKNGETDSQQPQPQQPSLAFSAQSKPVPFSPEAAPQPPQAEKDDHPPAAGPPKDQDQAPTALSTGEGGAGQQQPPSERPAAAKPKTGKKLSIRIPGLASITKALTPKAVPLAASADGATNPLAAAGDSSAKAAAKAPGDGSGLPGATEKASGKRKRESPASAPAGDASAEPATVAEPSTKRRIKVVLGKTGLGGSSSNTAAPAALEAQETPASGEPSVSLAAGSKKDAAVEEAPLAPPAVQPPAAEPKKKKKKADRAKSPRPLSPLPRAGEAETAQPEASKEKAQAGSSRAGATEKKSRDDGQASAKATGNDPAVLPAEAAAHRSGRKAAVDAKEKMSAKQKAKKEKEDAPPPESGKKKKKRRRQEDTEELKLDSDNEPNEWVQCDSCKKWRVLPDNVRASSLPDQWYCHMNIYDKKRNNCQAPEQNNKEVLKERKERKRRLKLKKKARREAELAESQQPQQQQGKKGKQQQQQLSGQDDEVAAASAPPSKKKAKLEKLNADKQTPRSTSPKPTGKTVKSKGSESKKAIAEAKRNAAESGKKSKVKSDDGVNPTDSGSDTKKETKKKGKKAKKEAQESSHSQDAETGADGKKRKRGRPARNQAIASGTSSPNAGFVEDQADEDNVEWVQCDKCQKWRKLPPHISSDELPDVWNCAMNTWNPDSASCEAAEDKTDAQHQEINGTSEWQLRQTHAGKYSYRQMIFGAAARKPNRPPSERARAAESLFVAQSTDEENPVPTTQYTKSSVFLPRVSNFNKNNATEEKALGIFDILKNSNLWDELRRMDPNPPKVLSTACGNIPGYPASTKMIKTYDSLTVEVKHAMQDAVLQTLEFGCLSSDEVVAKAQWFPFETSVVRAYCNPDIIVHTLLDLVRDGLVETNAVRNPFLPLSEWVPRYRRVGTRRAIEAVEAIKASRCIKISKPWKQRGTPKSALEEWVTGAGPQRS
ncbi:unnamed protein product [Pseudo-nitzschia multistriata]|uniref:CW-type domain-containing protein n=1 Tax=Pseudo-nitzschia multistriata TaxID=183589 RepID=A0A448YVM1_9STRA|nr:unnamed protein product [Pseudo-nitzschia multistriata]